MSKLSGCLRDPKDWDAGNADFADQPVAETQPGRFDHEPKQGRPSLASPGYSGLEPCSSHMCVVVSDSLHLRQMRATIGHESMK
jgi:hypothetical protein